MNAPRSWPKSSDSSSDSRERRAVEPNEGRLGARARGVDRLGDELLARAALAGHEDARLARPDLGHELEDRLHLGVARHDVTQRVALAQSIAQAARLLNEPRLLHRPLDDGAERLGIERLEEVILRALLHRVDGARDGAERRHDDEDRPGRRRPRLLHERDAVESRHLEVRQDDVRGELVELSERFEAVRRGLRREAVFAEDLAQRGPGVRFVVDDEDSTAVSHGRQHPSAGAAARRNRSD